jgi:hypothetical protein
MSTSTVSTGTDRPAATGARNAALTSIIGLAWLAVLLQGLWAGVFLEHDGRRDDAGGWIDIHARGGEVALALAAVATIVALVKLRRRTELWLGGVVLVALLLVEAYVGGLIRDDSKDTLTAFHVPLGMAIMAVSTWWFIRSARTR